MVRPFIFLIAGNFLQKPVTRSTTAQNRKNTAETHPIMIPMIGPRLLQTCCAVPGSM